MEAPRASAYVAIGERGLLKVGMTRDPDTRRCALRHEFRRKGDVLKRFEPCDAIHAAFGVEYSLIRHCEQTSTRHSGREWFTGADYDAVLGVAKRLTDERRGIKPLPRLTPEESRVLEAKWAEQRRLEAIRRAEHKLAAARRSAAFQFKRRTSERVIEAFVKFVVGACTALPEHGA